MAGRRVRAGIIAMVVVVLSASACTPPDAGGGTGTNQVTVGMNAAWSGGFFSLPWPNAIRKKANGTLDLFGIPSGDNIAISALAGVASDTVKDYGTGSAVYLQMSGAIDTATLPTPSASTLATSPVMLIDLAHPSERIPVVARIETPDKYRPANLLSLLPYPGFPLRSDADYAAVVTTGVHDATGAPLVAAPLISELDQPFFFGKARSESDWNALRSQRDAVRTALGTATSWAPSDLVGFTVFHTQDSQKELRAMAAAVADYPVTMPTWTVTTPCGGSASRAILSGGLQLPMYQVGGFPYRSGGGAVAIGADGKAVQQGTRTVLVGVGVPCATAPAGGWAIQTYIAGTGGSVDAMGSFSNTSTAALIGSIAPLYSYEGYGNVYDRNLFYNVLNPEAARTNPLQQSANNLVLFKMLEQLSLPASLASTPTAVTTNPAIEIVTGHSQGAQTVALVTSMKPGVDAIVSSASVSGLYNSTSYRSDVRLQFQSIIGDSTDLDIRNPLNQMLEMVMNAADPANYPTTGHWLNFAGKQDGCVPLESSRNLAGSQHLAVVNPQWGSIFGDGALDPVGANMPVSGNYLGTTRASVEADGGHNVALGNKAIVNTFLDGVVAGVTPVVDGTVNVGPGDSCGPRWGAIGGDS